jgi:nucleoid DNA-binding protein
MNMNERLTTRNLADILAIQTGLEKERAEKFIDTLSSYITQGIEKNKAVKVLGLGTFKIVLVRERESVHIHTGERFIIPAHHKLSFIPDKNLKEHINRPFAFFEPIEAAEEIYSLSPDKQVADDNDESDIEYEVDDQQPVVTDDMGILEPDELPAEPGDFRFISEDDPPVVEKSRVVSENVPHASEDIRNDVHVIHYDYNYSGETDTRWKENAENPAYLNTTHRTGNDDNTDEKAVSESLYGSNNKHKKTKTKVVAPLWLWFLLLPFFIVAGIGIATYAFLYYNAKTSNNIASPTDNNATFFVEQYDANVTKSLPVETQHISDPDNPVNETDHPENGSNDNTVRSDGENITGITDSVKNKETAGNGKSNENKRTIDWFALSSENANTESKQTDYPASATTSKPTTKQTEQKNSKAASTTSIAAKPQNTQAEKIIPARVRMTAGSSLTQIAMEHYGDKVFWVYIYDYNKSRIKDFDNIPVGMEIRLPQPKLYGINAKNKTSVQKARQKQSELLRWDKWDDYR